MAGSACRRGSLIRIEPWCYLRQLLLRLHAGDPRLNKMLPDRWAAPHPEVILEPPAGRTPVQSGPNQQPPRSIAGPTAGNTGSPWPAFMERATIPHDLLRSES